MIYYFTEKNTINPTATTTKTIINITQKIFLEVFFVSLWASLISFSAFTTFSFTSNIASSIISLSL